MTPLELIIWGNAVLELGARIFNLVYQVQSGALKPEDIKPEDLRLPDADEVIRRARERSGHAA